MSIAVINCCALSAIIPEPMYLPRDQARVILISVSIGKLSEHGAPSQRCFHLHCLETQTQQTEEKCHEAESYVIDFILSYGGAVW